MKLNLALVALKKELLSAARSQSPYGPLFPNIRDALTEINSSIDAVESFIDFSIDDFMTYSVVLRQIVADDALFDLSLQRVLSQHWSDDV